MKVIIEAASQHQSINKNLQLKGGFLVRTSLGSEADLKKLKINQKFYLYIEDTGLIGQTGGIFSHTPFATEVISLSAFRDAALYTYVLEPRRSIFGSDKQQATHRSAMQLKGSRCSPTYLDIKNVELGRLAIEDRELPYAYISGDICSSYDTRRLYLSKHEATEYGSGQFDIKDVKVLPNGNFVHLRLSPYAEDLEKIVAQQVEAFNQYSFLYSNAHADPAEKKLWVDKYEHTRKLLKPHANEVYKYDNRNLYFINSGGNWQLVPVNGLRNFDIQDRQRVRTQLESTGSLTRDLTKMRHLLSSKSLLDRKKIENLSVALQHEVVSNAKDDVDVLERQNSHVKTLKPSDVSITAAALPGLKTGVSLFPHQALILASLRDKSRMLVDADPGAGKALIIICDILQQMNLRKLKRPLVLMPESLLAQFAREVKHFSELNPWIISTESVKKWGKTGQLPEFMEDAKRAPRNTVFLTSYTWVSLDPEFVENGEISEGEGKIRYKNTKVFNRIQILLARLGIDAVYQDECHILRGSSNMARAAFGLAEVPIIRGLTGTVMAGNPYDVVASMAPINSSVFGTSKEFISDYTAHGSVNEYRDDAAKNIRSKLNNFGVLSIRKSAWMHLLPKIHRETHFVDLNNAQKKAYSALLSNILDEIRADAKLSILLKKIESALERGDEITAGPLLARFTPLDVFINAPSEAKDWLKGLMLGEDAISPKVKAINDIITRHLNMPNAGKVLVFVQYKEAAKNLLMHLNPSLRSVSDYYEGGMIDTLVRFKTPQDPLKILIAVDRSIVVGHNIQAANCIIHADLKWKPGDLSQREARAVRLGQSRDVYIHTVLVKGTAEVLKMARNISAEHLIAKANSDFTDKTMLQPMRMTLSNMQSFTDTKDVKPYLDRKRSLDEHLEKQSVLDRDKYGSTLVKPHSYSPISKLFKEAKDLKKVPSTRDFSGRVQENKDDLILKELEKLPENPTNPKYLNLSLMYWNSDWYIFSYKKADANGFLRLFGFTLMPEYYLMELTSKSEVKSIVDKLEKKLNIINKPEFEQQVREARVTAHGRKGILQQEEQKARRSVAAEVSEDFVDKKDDISINFSTLSGMPIVWVNDTFNPSDVEVEVLKRVGFKQQPAMWRKLTTRSQLQAFLLKIMDKHPNVKIANWTEFSAMVSFAFKGIDLTKYKPMVKSK